jgi:hypothetical protein
MRSFLALAPMIIGASATNPNERSQPVVTAESSIDCPACPKRLTIELLALDLNTCKRCTGTDANVRSAVDTVAGILREAGVEVDIRQVVVKTADQAERLRFESSPTVRVNGRDIAVELRESPCGDCGELCGCNGGVNCRVWVWQGKEHLEAPRAMIIDAILRAYAGSDRPAAVSCRPFRLPENLRKFFAASAVQPPPGAASGECCDKTACCEPDAKSGCCGPEPQSAKCGCK